jgi:hypothetical protein
MSIMLAFFWDCECILIETTAGSGELPTDLWKFASERLLQDVHFVRGDIGSFRFFIVGNVVDGFVGIERDMSAEIATDELGKVVWKYKIMEPKECRKEVVYRDISI